MATTNTPLDFPAAMADLDQTEICHLKTQLASQNHQLQYAHQLADLDQTEIAQLKDALSRHHAASGLETAALVAEIRALGDLKDVDQTQIVRLQARVDRLKADIALRDRRIQDLKTRDGQDGEEDYRLVRSLQEENHQLREKNSRLEEEIRQLETQLRLERQQEAQRAAVSPVLALGFHNQPAGSLPSFSPKTPLFPGASDEEDATLAFNNLNIEVPAKGGDSSDSGFEGYNSDDAWDFI